MANNVVVIEDGLKTYDIANKSGKVYGSFSFDPSDIGIVRRYDEVVKFFETLNIDFAENDIAQNIEKIVELENIIFEKFNSLFNSDIAKEFFAITSPLTPLPSGKIFLESAIEAIGQAIEKETGERVKKMNNRISKHTSKYTGRQNG